MQTLAWRDDLCGRSSSGREQPCSGKVISFKCTLATLEHAEILLLSSFIDTNLSDVCQWRCLSTPSMWFISLMCVNEGASVRRVCGSSQWCVSMKVRQYTEYVVHLTDVCQWRCVSTPNMWFIRMPSHSVGEMIYNAYSIEIKNYCRGFLSNNFTYRLPDELSRMYI